MITIQDTIFMGTAAPASGGGGSVEAVWGAITGTLSNQTDLQDALDAKLEKTAIATSVSASSTNNETVGAKLFYDTVGDVETLLSQV